MMLKHTHTVPTAKYTPMPIALNSTHHLLLLLIDYLQTHIHIITVAKLNQTTNGMIDG